MTTQLAKKDESRQVAAVTPMSILQSAQETGASVETLQKLMELQMTWETNEARKAFNEAFTNFKSEQFKIIKDAEVDFTGQKGRTHYKHSSLAHIVDVVVPLLSKYGLSHSWTTEQNNGAINVTCKVSHKLGHTEAVTLSAGSDQSGNKNSIQAVGSTVTYLQRYTLVSILGLASHQTDDDGVKAGTSEPLVDDNQLANIDALITETGANVDGFLVYMKAKSLDTIKAKDYDKAIKALEAKRGPK